MSALAQPTGGPLRPPAIDIAIAACFVALTVAEALSAHDDRSAWRLGIALVGVGALAWRRRAPILVAAILVGADLLSNPEGRFSTVLALVTASYTVGFESPSPRRYAGLALLVVPFVGAAVARPEFEFSDLAASVVFIVGPWMVGLATAVRAERAATAIAHADRVQREQAQREADAVADERARIARELHDVVAHSLTVVTIQLQAVRRRLGEDNRDEARDLSAAEAVTREAMGEMRRLLGVLRGGGGGDLAPQPGLDELPRLIARLGSPGTPVTLTVAGQPVALSPGMDLAVFRVAQEALTNATRHAHASRIDVEVRWDGGRVTVTVSDDGRGLGDTASAGGHGLVGMRERVALYDGTLQIGDRPGGGVTVSATFPVEEAA
ncbi:sensor histidine kinase [Demequina sp. NBRC 110051]|uniref:sensor histidine kinase n=1 Tax=Demequina sp. NBRC 110051 TaxID=1570340 RepID=UPI000A074367|nr:sensor histidine kinase [Demequina sp. NBRC 110051]